MNISLAMAGGINRDLHVLALLAGAGITLLLMT
jgi:hypothetical protein